MSKLIALLVALVLLLLGGAWFVWGHYQQFLSQPLAIARQAPILLVEPGMTGRGVISRLDKMGVTDSGWEWRVLLKTEPFIVQAGEYRLHPGMRPRELLRMLEQGDVVTYRFTLVEGWNVQQLIDAFFADPMLGPRLREAVDETDLRSNADKYGIEEGALLPETYVYTRGDTYLDIVKRATGAMEDALAEAWDVRVEDHPVKSPYELLILASIIEKETGLDEERDDISGVFVRRLKKGMKLQTDPTVIYGLGADFDGDIRRRDLRTDTPYNTYTRTGLPPTPIAMPGRASLMAAARPAEGETLFFVADGTGGHTFSVTLEEHQKGVDKLNGKK